MQAQPEGTWHSSAFSMQVSPHALPLVHVLQHSADSATAVGVKQLVEKTRAEARMMNFTGYSQ